MRDLAVERLSTEELEALDLARLRQAHFDVFAEMAALGRLVREQRLVVTDCKKAVRRDKNDVEAACKLLDAQALFDNIRDRIRTLKELKTSIQTALKLP